MFQPYKKSINWFDSDKWKLVTGFYMSRTLILKGESYLQPILAQFFTVIRANQYNTLLRDCSAKFLGYKNNTPAWITLQYYLIHHAVWWD